MTSALAAYRVRSARHTCYRAAAADPIDVTYQQWILLALVFSLVGDIALMFKGDRWFLGGSLCSRFYGPGRAR